MAFEWQKAHTVSRDGLSIDDAILVCGGVDSPVGNQAPTGSVYFQTDGKLWYKHGALAEDWSERAFANQAVSGAVPPFIWSRGGSCPTGTHLKVGDVVTTDTGQLIPGTNQIVTLRASNKSAVNQDTRIQFYYRTGESTFQDIPGAYVDIPSGAYFGIRSGLSISVGPDYEVGCYLYSGSNLKSVVAGMFVIPVVGS